MLNAGTDRRSRSSVGTVAAVAILLVSGTGYRVFAGWFGRSSDAMALPVGTLGGVPLELEGWAGQDIPLADVIIKRTDTDDHINRTYRQKNGRAAVSVFAGCGVKVRDLLPHRPEVCYTGAGWTLNRSETIEVTASDGRPLPCQVHTFFRPGLDQGGITVLNYYIVDGEYSPDVSLLRSKAWRLTGETSYVAQVQIAGRTDAVGRDAEAGVRAFAADSAADFRRVLQHAVEQMAGGG